MEVSPPERSVAAWPRELRVAINPALTTPSSSGLSSNPGLRLSEATANNLVGSDLLGQPEPRKLGDGFGTSAPQASAAAHRAFLVGPGTRATTRSSPTSASQRVSSTQRPSSCEELFCAPPQGGHSCARIEGRESQEPSCAQQRCSLARNLSVTLSVTAMKSHRWSWMVDRFAYRRH